MWHHDRVSSESVLSSAIEVAIGIAGFAGIAAAIRQRDVAAWEPRHRLLLQMLFGASAAAIVLGFLPALLAEASVEPPTLWRIGSATVLVWVLGIGVFRIRQARSHEVSALRDLAGWPTTVVSFLVTALQVLNLVLAVPWPYLVGVIGILANGFIFFLRLLLSPRAS